MYINKSTDIDLIVRSNFFELKNGKHCNFHLQNDFDFYGPQSFESSVLRICDSFELERYESLFIYEKQSFEYKHGYNTNKPIDYRKLSHEDAVTLKDDFLEHLFTHFGEKIKKAGKIEFPIEWFCKNLVIDQDEALIMLKSINKDDVKIYRCSFDLRKNNNSNYSLYIKTEEEIKKLIMRISDLFEGV